MLCRCKPSGKQTQVILGDSKRQIVKKFGQAALTYTDNPVAVHLRAMNMLYKGLRKIPQSSSFQVRLLSRCHWGLTAVTIGIQVLRNYEKRFLTYSDPLPVSPPAKGELKWSKTPKDMQLSKNKGG